MRKIREALRLSWVLSRSQREVAASCGMASSSVSLLLRRARETGLKSFEDAQALDDAALELLLYPPPLPRSQAGPEPDWQEVYQELKRDGVTLSLLWEEYRKENPVSYGYSWFCEGYRQFVRSLEVSLRQDYKAGEQMQVDWAGQGLAIKKRESGETAPASLFVACLGASQLIYAEATSGMGLREWIGAHVGALEYFGGATEIVVPDNTKSGVTSPCRYEPELNPTYAEMAQHYGMAVIPTRVRRPRDKAKVENAVQQVERWILAKLRNVTFFDLASANRAIGRLLEELNDRPLKELGISRRQLFEKVDKPALRPLPAERYAFGSWKRARVGPDYHVDIERHFYSVPYRLVRQQVDVRIGEHLVEIFQKSQSVARHERRAGHGYSTIPDHMPKSHQEYVSWTPARLVEWARKNGEATARLVEAIIAERSQPQQAFRSCLGLLSLGKRFGADRLEAACERALRIQSLSYKSVKSILKTGLDRQKPPVEEPTAASRVVHDNVRGPAYYGAEVAP